MIHDVVSREEWIEKRKALLDKEKAFTRKRDALSAERRNLPWVRVEEDYHFEGPNGNVSLSNLFAGRSQLVVYHFMYGTDWEEGCPSCSFWADNFDGIPIHLAHRDVTFIATSRGPYDKLAAYKKRMGWHFDWYSTRPGTFSEDYHVSFSPEALEAQAAYYNYRENGFRGPEAPGISVFYKDPESGGIFHTYSCYARGLDMLNGAYHYLDLVPKGRDEGDGIMAWLRRKDQYDD